MKNINCANCGILDCPTTFVVGQPCNSFKPRTTVKKENEGMAAKLTNTIAEAKNEISLCNEIILSKCKLIDKLYDEEKLTNKDIKGDSHLNLHLARLEVKKETQLYIADNETLKEMYNDLEKKFIDLSKEYSDFKNKER